MTIDSGATARHMRSVVLITTVTAVGGFLFGFDNGAISGSVGLLEQRFGLDADTIGWITSSIIVGCLTGVAAAGRLADLIGRKKVLLATALVFAVGALGEALAPTPELLVAARILVGIGIGIETTVAPLYIAEVAPARIRGRMVSFNQLFNTVGNLAVFFTAAVIVSVGGEAWGVEQGWRWIFGVGVVPAVLFLALLFLVPESPRWLVRRGRTDNALEVLRRINPSDGDARSQLAEIERTTGAGGEGRLADLFAPRLRKALLAGFGVALFQQITGINAVFYYAPEIFRDAGLDTSGALSSTVLIGVTLVAATLVSMWIIDRVGRKALLVVGATGMTVALTAVGLLFRQERPDTTLLLVLLLAYVAVFAVSFGTVTYVLISEIFPTRVRGAAASIATFALWGGNFLVSRYFPLLVERLGASPTFFVFAGTSLVALVFVLLVVPETRGRSLEEIERALHGRPGATPTGPAPGRTA